MVEMEEGKRDIEGLGVKLMTDEQLEMLRKQISVYATICELLVQKHKEISSKPELAGFRPGNPYCDPLFSSGIFHASSRQRWIPTPQQIDILEHIFEQCNNATPSRQRIKEITSNLVQHGQVSETNIYNWFQNRRARSKRKQQALVSNIVDTKVEPAEQKRTNPEDIQPDESSSLMTHHMYIWSPDIGFDQLVGEMVAAQGSYDPFWQVEQYEMFD